MRRTRSYAKFLAFALAVSLAFQSAPAMAGKFNPSAENSSSGITVGQAGTGAVYGTVSNDDTSSIAIGNGSAAQKGDGTATADAIAVGTDATASGKNATAIGNGSNALRDNATAIGTGAVASGLSTVVIGEGAKASGYYSIAIGHNGGAGDGAPTTGLNAIAIGTDTVAIGENSVAIGFTAEARGASSLALGEGAGATGKNSVALGIEAYSNANNSVALGRNSLANEENVVSIGNDAAKITRRLVNMAAGRADTDAVNVDQLNSALDIFGNGTTVNDTNGAITSNGFTYRDDTTTTTVQDVFTAIDEDIDELDTYAVKYTAGHSNRLMLTDSGSGSGVQIRNVAGENITEDSTYAVNGAQLYSLAESIAGKLGVTYSGGTTFDNFSVDINGTTYDNVADAIEKLAEGWNIKGADGTPGTGGTPGAGTGTGNGNGNVAPGGSLNVEAGSNIKVTVGGGTTPGDADLNISVSDTPEFDSVTAGTITANDKVTVGTGDKQTVIDGTTGKVTVGDSNSDTYTEIGSGKLQVNTNIGNIHADNSGLQVFNNQNTVRIGYEGSISVTNKNNNQGTRETVSLKNGTGTFTNANGTTKIDGQKGTFGLAGNQTVIDGGTVTVDNQITVGGANGTVVDNNSVSINNNSAFFRENSMKVGNMTYDGLSNTLNMGGAGRLTGLADGGVYMGSTDAVTGNQLWQAYKRMDQLQESINIVGAHAAALSGLHPIDYNPYEPTTLSAAIGTYRDEYAVAVGVFHYVRENVLFNLGASICSDGDLMGRAGVSFTVGKSPDKPKVAGTMNGLRNQVVTMQAKLDELEAEKKRDKETIARNAEALKKNEEIMKKNAELIRELTKKLEAQK